MVSTARRNARVEYVKTKPLVTHWFEEVWNNGHADVIGDMFAADGWKSPYIREARAEVEG